MQLPDKPIRILGLPWTVEHVDLIEGDPANASDFNQGKCLMQISSETPETRWKWNIFWCVVAAIQLQICNARHRPSAGDISTIHQALWIGLRDNWQEVRKWFGYDGNQPEVLDGTVLRLGGADWQVRRPQRLPNKGLNFFGLCDTGAFTIQVRQGLSPEFAVSTAMHELMHASLHSLDPLWDDESFIEPVSSGLTQVFFDNPEWVEFIFGEETEEKEALDP